jgi:hypothetical protein
MTRRRTGLRNRRRQGVGTYSAQGKARAADRYGRFSMGVPQSSDSIAGHSVWAVKRQTESSSW